MAAAADVRGTMTAAGYPSLTALKPTRSMDESIGAGTGPRCRSAQLTIANSRRPLSPGCSSFSVWATPRQESRGGEGGCGRGVAAPFRDGRKSPLPRSHGRSSEMEDRTGGDGTQSMLNGTQGEASGNKGDTARRGPLGVCGAQLCNVAQIIGVEKSWVSGNKQPPGNCGRRGIEY